MPAYFDQGFCVRIPSWHRQEILLGDYPGRVEAMKLAGHDFKVFEMPVLVQGKKEQRPAPDFKALVHGTTGEILNVVKSTYVVVQNEVLWDIVDAIVNQDNVKYDTAGVLCGGNVLWVSALLDEPIQIAGDDSLTLPYIVASTSHDGTGALQAQSTMVRVVCANTKAMADADSKKRGTAFVFRHTKNVRERIDEAIAVVRGTRGAANAYREMAEQLGSLPITPQQHRTFLEEFIPMPLVRPGTLVSERVVSNIAAARLQVEKLFDGPTIPEAHRATGYGLFLAGTEYLDHFRTYRNNDTYLGRTLLKSEPAKEGLATLIREVAAN